MEAETAKGADGSQRASLVRAHNALSGILNHDQVVLAGDVDNGVHLACDACIVNGNDHAGLIGDRCLDLLLVDVHRVRSDVNEDERRTHGLEGRRGRGEREAGENDLVPRLKVAEDSRHLEGIGAGSGKKYLLGVEALLHPRVALAREGSVAANLMVDLGGLPDVVHLGPHIGRNIEVDQGALHKRDALLSSNNYSEYRFSVCGPSKPASIAPLNKNGINESL